VAIRLQLPTAETSTTVSAFETLSLVTPEDTGTRGQINQKEIERLALSVANRGLEAVVQTFPGFAQNANGSIHPRGAHTQMSFLIDGMPITDQLTGRSPTRWTPNIVQNVENFTGNIPAEFGAKVAAVINVNTKSGLGVGTRPLTGSTAVSAAGYDTVGQVTQLARAEDRLGYSGLLNTMKSSRYLDSVSLDNLHNGGNSSRGFVRLDYQASDRDVFRVNLPAWTGAVSVGEPAQPARQRDEPAAGVGRFFNGVQLGADARCGLHLRDELLGADVERAAAAERGEYAGDGDARPAADDGDADASLRHRAGAAQHSRRD
jgi:hypothetical protein